MSMENQHLVEFDAKQTNDNAFLTCQILLPQCLSLSIEHVERTEWIE